MELLDSFGIQWQLLVLQLVCFGVIFFFLRAFAYKKVIQMLDDRAARIKEGLDQSDEAEKRAADIDSQAKEALAEARKEGQVLMVQAKEAADARRQEDMAQAKKDAEALLDRARAEILLEKDRAISELRKEFADIAIFAAGKVINEELDADKHKKVIDEVIEASSFKL